MRNFKKVLQKIPRAAKKLRAVFFAATAFSVCALIPDAAAQGRLQGVGKIRISPTQNISVKEASADRDTDMFVGMVVRIYQNTVIVRVMSRSKITGKEPFYYGCDNKMRITTLLEETSLRHKSCAEFRVTQGKAAVGDFVMARYFKNEPEESSAPAHPANTAE